MPRRTRDERDPSLEADGRFSIHSGRKATSQLQAGTPPTGVFCASDEMALGAMWAAAEGGVVRPR